MFVRSVDTAGPPGTSWWGLAHSSGAARLAE